MSRIAARVRERLGNDERGALAPAFPIIALALFLLGGLIVDGSRDLNGKGQAQAYAEEAARRGAQQIDQGYAGVRLLPEDQVAAKVTQFCDQLRATGQLGAADPCGIAPGGYDQNAAKVTVQVRMKVSTTLLQAFGFGDFTVTGTGTAQAFQGITGANQ